MAAHGAESRPVFDSPAPVCPPVRVLCLGNELLGDDAFGILVGREVEKLYSPEQVEVLTSSASGLHLLDQVLGCERLIVIDTVESGSAPPGTMYVLDESDLPKSKGDSPHCTGLFDALALARKLGLPAPREITVTAVEAADCRTIGGSMDERVAEAIGRATALVRERIGAPRPARAR